MNNTTEKTFDRIKAGQIICKRCINHEQCMGTGCEPRRILLEMIKEGDSKHNEEQIFLKH